ncbi:18789_t:CDS:1, partial [Racocetra persica]
TPHHQTDQFQQSCTLTSRLQFLKFLLAFSFTYFINRTSAHAVSKSPRTQRLFTRPSFLLPNF